MPYRPQNLSATDLEPAVSSIMHDDPQSGGAERRLNYYIMLYQRAHTHTHICCGNVITGRRIVEWTRNDQCSTFILLVWFTCAFFRRPAEAKYNNNIHLWIIDNNEHTHTQIHACGWHYRRLTGRCWFCFMVMPAAIWAWLCYVQCASCHCYWDATQPKTTLPTAEIKILWVYFQSPPRPADGAHLTSNNHSLAQCLLYLIPTASL